MNKSKTYVWPRLGFCLGFALVLFMVYLNIVAWKYPDLVRDYDGIPLDKGKPDSMVVFSRIIFALVLLYLSSALVRELLSYPLTCQKGRFYISNEHVMKGQRIKIGPIESFCNTRLYIKCKMKRILKKKRTCSLYSVISSAFKDEYFGQIHIDCFYQKEGGLKIPLGEKEFNLIDSDGENYKREYIQFLEDSSKAYVLIEIKDLAVKKIKFNVYLEMALPLKALFEKGDYSISFTKTQYQLT